MSQRKENPIKADVRMISGCDDHQTSADISSTKDFRIPTTVLGDIKGAGGACTAAITATLHSGGGQGMTWVELLEGIRGVLKQKRYTQIPQMSSSFKVDLQEKVSFANEASPNGNKKALLIGINYIGQQGQLSGCHNDIRLIQNVIKSQGFENAQKRVLMDDGSAIPPTRENILAGFQWLIQGAKAGDSLFMQFSGHGGQVRDTSNDEKDGKDETMVPVDYVENGQITDDEIFEKLVLPLPGGVRLFIIMDCCHSGSIIDLPLVFNADDAHMSNPEQAQMEPNPEFNWQRVVQIGRKLLEMKSQGASNSQLAFEAARDLAASEGFFTEVGKLFQLCCGTR